MKNFLKSINSNKATYTLLFFSLVMSIFILNVGYENFENIKMICDEIEERSYKYTFMLSINSKEQFNINDKINLIKEYLSNFDVSIIEQTEISDNKATSINLVTTNKELDKKIPIIKGRYFNLNQNEKVAVVGKDINNNDSIYIGGEKYKVVGIAGRVDKRSVYDNEVYIPIEAMPDRIKSQFNYVTTLKLKSDKDSGDEAIKNFINKVKEFEKGSSTNIKDVCEFSGDGLFDIGAKDFIMKRIIKLYVLAIINCMIMGYFASLDRKKEISIMKVFGSKNFHIIVKFLSEYLAIGILAAMVAIMLEGIYIHFAINWFNISMKISIKTIFISGIASIISTLLTGIIPMLNALLVQPAEILKE